MKENDLNNSENTSNISSPRTESEKNEIQTTQRKDFYGNPIKKGNHRHRVSFN